jgi:hypothetical protein
MIAREGRCSSSGTIESPTCGDSLFCVIAAMLPILLLLLLQQLLTFDGRPLQKRKEGTQGIALRKCAALYYLLSRSTTARYGRREETETEKRRTRGSSKRGCIQVDIVLMVPSKQQRQE